MIPSMFSGRARVHALLSIPLSSLPCPAVAAGWILRARFGKSVGFLDVSDGSTPTPLQVVLPTVLLEAMPELRALGPGCAVLVRGDFVSSRGAGHGDGARLHLWPHFPCRAFAHQSSSGRVLDGRTRVGVC